MTPPPTRRGQARTTHLIVNFSPLAVDESNAAMEVWPRTHLATAADAGGACNPQTRNDAAFMLEDFPALLRQYEPARMVAKLGAVCFRDARCWHRGVPNASAVPRPLVALIYNAASLHRADPHLNQIRDARRPSAGRPDVVARDELLFGSDCAGAFDAPNLFGVDRNVRFTEDAVDHLGRVAAGLPPPLRGCARL